MPQMQARRLLELDLRQALQCGQFEVFYQPLIDLRDAARSPASRRCCAGAIRNAASCRPSEFIPLAEEIGLIVADRRVGAAAGLRRRRRLAGRAEGRGQHVAGAVQKPQSRRLRSRLRCAQSGLPPDRLELEITETVMLQDTEATLATLHQLRALGVRIAMDDFGTGYSSLSYLRRFPFDRIKIDQSFVRELGRSRDCGAIVRAVAASAGNSAWRPRPRAWRRRNSSTRSRGIGCTEAQGYLFSPAVPMARCPN